MKTIILAFLIIFPASVMAEPKSLVCETSAESESARLRSLAEKRMDPNYKSYNVKSAKELEKIAEQCIGADYGLQNTFVFDTDGLKNSTCSNVEVSRKFQCGRGADDVVKGTLEATPNIITIKFMEFSTVKSFNIDRKTLAGGFDTERKFSCKLFDVDTSQNLL